MKIPFLMLSTILTSVLTMQSAVAAESANATGAPPAASSTPQPQAQSEDQNLQATASSIIGNISIADIALAYGMYDDASTHLDAARKDISAFNSRMATYNSNTPLIGGKIRYKTVQGEKDYWIPLTNERFSVEMLGGKNLDSQHPRMDVADAQMVHYKIFLDTKSVDSQLAKAQSDLKEKKYDTAMLDLNAVTKGAVTETVIQDRPLEAVNDNLILAKELLKNKDYKGASFALKHAHGELADYAKANPDNKDSESYKHMQSQIATLRTFIDKQDPSALKEAEMKVEGWIKDLKNKIHS